MKAFTRPQKILAVVFELSGGLENSVQYEDIVVRVFEKYPSDFQLRGYPHYPDSSDIHKPLYAMKKKGLLVSASKMFQLTELGLETAAQIVHSTPSKAHDRLTKSEEREISRITRSAAFALYNEGKINSILDTDFFDYLGASVRTGKNEFIGRLNTVKKAIESHKDNIDDKLSEILLSLHEKIADKFDQEITTRSH